MQDKMETKINIFVTYNVIVFAAHLRTTCSQPYSHPKTISTTIPLCLRTYAPFLPWNFE